MTLLILILSIVCLLVPVIKGTLERNWPTLFSNKISPLTVITVSSGLGSVGGLIYLSFSASTVAAPLVLLTALAWIGCMVVFGVCCVNLLLRKLP